MTKAELSALRRQIAELQSLYARELRKAKREARAKRDAEKEVPNAG